MRKITILLVAMFAVVGSALAALPQEGAVGYLYNPAKKVFLNDKVGADATGVLYQIKDEGTTRTEAQGFVEDPASETLVYTYLRFAANKNNDQRLSVSATGLQHKNEYGVWACREVEGEGFMIRCVYKHSQRAWIESEVPCGLYLAVDENYNLGLSAEKTYWQFIPEEDAETYAALAAEAKTAYDAWLAAKEAAEAQATKDALAALNGGEGPKAGDELLAALFPNAGFDASNNTDGWTVTTNGGNAPSYKVINGNCGMTKYQGTIKMEKTIKGLPAGWYTLKAQAFGRKGDFVTNKAKFEAGEELETPGVIFANGVTKQVPNVFDGLIDETEERKFVVESDNESRFDLENPSIKYFGQVTVDGVNKYVLDNSNSGSYSFSIGNYETELIVYVAEGEALTFGFDKNTADGGDYCGCDNFRLIYEGTAMPQTFADGKYYLYNVEAKRFWGASNNWGTKASLVEHPEYITLHYKENGYQIETLVNNGGTQYYFNGDFMDNGSPKSLFIVPFGKYYKIYASDAVYGYDGTSTVLGTKAEGDAAAWQIITEDDMKAQLAKATAKEPVDATFLILNPNFGRNNRWGGSLSTKNDQVKNADLGSAWSFEAGNKDVNGDVTNYCVESYHSVFSLSQTISGAPKGTYALTAQGFYRQDGSDNDNLPVFFANDKNATFPLKTGTENSMSDASKSFTNGLYTIEPIIFEVGDDGTITLGAKLENNTSLWCIWDNFVLKYYGPDATELDVKAAQAIEDYQKALAEAQKVDLNAKMNVSLKSQFETSLDTYAEDKVLTTDATKESIEQATAILTQMTETVKSNIADYAATAKALETYGAKALELDAQGQATYDVADIEAVYNDCTMESDKSEDVLAAFETAVKAQGVGADMTGAVRNADCTEANNAYWTIEGGNTFHTNTWSTENDESGLKVPFIEDWVGGGKTLADATITHVTIEGLPAGKYSVSGFIRAFAEDHADVTPTGACIFANGVDGDDISTGTTAVFNSKSGEVYGTYTVKCEVGDDGLLTFGIKVKDANDFFDWIAFKNFTVIYEDLPTAITEVGGKTAIANNNAIFNIAGQQVKNLQKGLNIVDGQKVFVK
jgi:hypothetical protein